MLNFYDSLFEMIFYFWVLNVVFQVIVVLVTNEHVMAGKVSAVGYTINHICVYATIYVEMLADK